MEEGKIEGFPMPCAFVEMSNPTNHQQLAQGFTQSDLLVRIHIGADQYDAGDGTMEQNMTIFDLRDQIVKALTYYQPAKCGRMMKVSENQDFEHTNMYHYIVEFTMGFVDSEGDNTAAEIDYGPPTTLEIDPTIETTITVSQWPAP